MVFAVALGLAVAPLPARAVVDYPASIALPDWDISVGLLGGVAFGESTRGNVGWLSGVEVGVHDGVIGLQTGLHLYREGEAERLAWSVEATAWYVLLFGIGFRAGGMLDDGGRDVPQTETALTVSAALPFALWRIDDGAAGTLVVAPVGRVGFRIFDGGQVRGHHEVGLMLRWTSFGWGH